MGASLSWADWTFEPTVTCGLAALVVLYVVGGRKGWWRPTRLGVGATRSARTRGWLFTAGVAVMLLALCSPIDRGGDEYLLSIHMIQHLLLMMVAPPLLLLSIAGTRALDGLPRTGVGRAWVRITGLWLACGALNAVLLVWHYPNLYNATLTIEPLHVFEHLTFIAVGLVFWWPIVEPARSVGGRGPGPLAKIAMLVVAGIPPTVLGLLFDVAPRPVYPFYAAAPRLWGISALIDQQIAGVVMFGVGNAIYFVAIAPIFWRLFGDPAADEQAAQTVQRPA